MWMAGASVFLPKTAHLGFVSTGTLTSAFRSALGMTVYSDLKDEDKREGSEEKKKRV